MAEKLLQNVNSKDRPTMEQLSKVMRIEHIDIVTKWHELGLELVDSHSALKQIEANHRNDVNTCCRMMFDKWLERTPDASWSQLVTALCEIEMKSAADVISKQLNSDNISVDVEDTQSEKVVQFATPDEASVEFGILLDEIVQELEKDKINNLRKLQTISSTLTIHKNSKVHVFTDKQLEEIQACDNIHTLLIYKLRHCYRWDDFAMLTKLMSSIKAKRCLGMLKKFDVKINSKLKLQQIYEQCKQNSFKFSAEYRKIAAVVDGKIFSEITQKEYDVLKHFVSEQCGVEDYVISPVATITISSLILEWYIPVTATAHMIKTALRNKVAFIANCFLCLKISSTLILDDRDITTECDQLYLAAKNGDVATIETLINKKYIDINAILPQRIDYQLKKTALHYGSENGHAAVVEALIRAEADINTVNKFKMMPLHYGSENGHAVVVEALIRAGADVSAVDKWKKTALHYSSKNGHAAVVETLIRAGADVNAVDECGMTSLHFGSSNGHTVIAEALIRAGADVSVVDSWERTALHYGSENGHIVVVEALIRAGAVIDAADNWQKKTALHYGSKNGHSFVVEALIKAGADVNTVDDWQQKTALHYSSENGYTPVVDALIRAGANVNAADKYEKTALHYGSKYSHSMVVKALIRAGAVVKRDASFRTDTMILDSYTSSLDCRNAKKKIMRNYSKLTKLPIDLILDNLFAKKVITYKEKKTVQLKSKIRMEYFLDRIILPSLTNNIIAKFKGFLEVMEESDDLSLIDLAKKLGGSE